MLWPFIKPLNTKGFWSHCCDISIDEENRITKDEKAGDVERWWWVFAALSSCYPIYAIYRDRGSQGNKWNAEKGLGVVSGGASVTFYNALVPVTLRVKDSLMLSCPGHVVHTYKLYTQPTKDFGNLYSPFLFPYPSRSYQCLWGVLEDAFLLGWIAPKRGCNLFLTMKTHLCESRIRQTWNTVSVNQNSAFSDAQKCC